MSAVRRSQTAATKHMRVVLQRVSSARVTVAGRITGQIGRGLLLFVGIENADTANGPQGFGFGSFSDIFETIFQTAAAGTAGTPTSSASARNCKRNSVR